MTPNETRILTVDDDASMIRMITETLEPVGYRILSANDGNQGLACIEFYKPDLVLLDLMMPHRGGLIVLEGMRQLDDYIPVIMITANDGTRHRNYAEVMGADAYLQKPVRPEVLVRTVERILRSVAANGQD